MDFTTDADGWGYDEFHVKGKERLLTVVWDMDNDGLIDEMVEHEDGTFTGDYVTQVAMDGGAGRWALAELQIDDLGTYGETPGAYVIDEFVFM